MITTSQNETPKYEVTNVPLLTIKHKLGSVKFDNIGVLLISPPAISAKVRLLSECEHFYEIQQAQVVGEDLEEFWSNLVANFEVFLEFTAACLQNKLTPFFVNVERERIANSYALGYLLLSGLTERSAIAVMIEKNRAIEFDYYTACLLDKLMCRDNKLVEVISEYETTGIVVSPQGITYTKE